MVELAPVCFKASDLVRLLQESIAKDGDVYVGIRDADTGEKIAVSRFDTTGKIVLLSGSYGVFVRNNGEVHETTEGTIYEAPPQ